MDLKKRPTLFLFITDDCNLKCSGCMQSCDRIKDPYYLPLSELNNYLKILKRNNFIINDQPIEEVHLTGGDPLMHPAFIKICEMIHDFLPSVKIQISTNGLFLHKLSDKQLIHLSEDCNVGFQISLYPKLSLLAMYEKLLQRAQQLNVFLVVSGGSHFFFSKQDKILNDSNAYKGYSKICENVINKQNHAILYKGKIYCCWKDINFLQKAYSIDDGLNLYELPLNAELIHNERHAFCELCAKNAGSGGEEFFLWHHHLKEADIIFNHSMKELFINNYELYHKLHHDIKDEKKILSTPIFQEHLSDNQKRFANTRFLDGKGDVFIPFSKEINTDLKEILENYPDIIDYNLYFISINNKKEIEKKAYEVFVPYYTPENLNNYFLKANNMVSAYKIFLENSYLEKKFFLDIDENIIYPFNG